MDLENISIDEYLLENVDTIPDFKSPDVLLSNYSMAERDIKSIKDKIAMFKMKHLDIFNALEKMESEISELESKKVDIKEELTESMSKSNVGTISNDLFKITFVKSTIRKDFDKKKFQAENEDMYSKYLKETEVKAYIRITEV